MGMVRQEDIVAIWWDENQIVCSECLSNDDWDNLKEDQIITSGDIERDEETLYFCDRCKKQIK